LFLFFQVLEDINNIRKNNAVITYAKKFVSGSGKKNRTTIPVRTINKDK
jgi:catabolite regulation protein CreA